MRLDRLAAHSDRIEAVAEGSSLYRNGGLAGRVARSAAPRAELRTWLEPASLDFGGSGNKPQPPAGGNIRCPEEVGA